jgi:hypothetical protein
MIVILAEKTSLTGVFNTAYAWLGIWFLAQTLDESNEGTRHLEQQIEEIRQLVRDDL